MKRPLRTCLSPELLWNIVAWINLEADFFAFLDALGSLRGPFEPLWQLGLIKPRHLLWPTLRVSSTLVVNAVDQGYVEAILKLHPRVAISANSFHGVECFLHPSAETIFAAGLPRLISQERLPSLTLLGSNVGLTNMFESGVSSLTLVDLAISTKFRAMVTADTLRNMIRWLNNASLHTINLSNWAFDDDVDESMRVELYKTLFYHPSMVEIELSRCSLPSLGCLPRMRQLSSLRMVRITQCRLSPKSILGLAKVVQRAPELEALNLDMGMINDNSNPIEPNERYLAAFRLLFEAMAQCCVKYLALDYCGLFDSYWQDLGPLLQCTAIERLSLVENGIGDNGIQSIGRAIQTNSSIQFMDLSNNNFSEGGLLTLFDSVKRTNLEKIRMAESDIESFEVQKSLRNKASMLGLSLEFFD
ncbi:Aste57867_24856 [Aphanomyces stellatus]|uniref:Aste57867_24856 protein n=1 Tax=Aphanomyces stellatus TaxID=120398 RepID=A0A485LRM3_9STRA|nr:hypothetical protein As57867_024778 [Aphanomyces stellatus]VFU01490.1 Aste57867_24856 [Aphanomyces stellatus]